MHIIRRAMHLWDRLTIRTKPMGAMHQASCGMVMAEQIVDKAWRLARNTGNILYNQLPAEMAAIVMRRDWDPYHKAFDKKELRDWLWDHVVFDNNAYIVAIHDKGEILTCQEGWECEAEYFSRVRSAEENG